LYKLWQIHIPVCQKGNERKEFLCDFEYRWVKLINVYTEYVTLFKTKDGRICVFTTGLQITKFVNKIMDYLYT